VFTRSSLEKVRSGPYLFCLKDSTEVFSQAGFMFLLDELPKA